MNVNDAQIDARQAGFLAKLAHSDVEIDRGRQAGGQVYQILRRAIAELDLMPNEPVSEQAVAAALQLSRTPIREAFLLLAEEGLLDAYPQLGTFVAPLRLDTIHRSQFVREALECAIARRAAELINEAAAKSLRATLKRQRSLAKAKDWQAFYAADEQMHEDICRLSGVVDVWKTVQSAKIHLDRVRRLTLPIHDRIENVLEQHAAIVDAIIDSHPDRAEAAARVHMRDVLHLIPALREGAPHLFARPTVYRRQNPSNLKEAM
ncbi:GntR family transcriptional regulator [Paraburkholderia sp. DHOC27]|uniref:GntR family transcriptional regulator n=1 Tax=Paraburkholderia sp. DHOC27 TaxID=2303330 RepID=UPI000E3D84F1|nr:GntR family transcriptional regulator [Paraburkholderia sp. DHOC27]RFU48347.1 GntR family transcriptional regulator [Paraburkholderia sp. DHOC27]